MVASAINLLNPDVIAVWGYLVDTGDQFLVGMQEAIYKTALPASARAVSLARSPHGDDAGLRGAALTVIEHDARSGGDRRLRDRVRRGLILRTIASLCRPRGGYSLFVDKFSCAHALICSLSPEVASEERVMNPIGRVDVDMDVAFQR